MSITRRPFYAFAAALLWPMSALFSPQAGAQPMQWVDVHFHFIAESEDAANELASAGLELMKQEGIQTLVIMPPPQRGRGVLDGERLVEILRPYGSGFAVIGGGGTLNPMMHRMAQQANLGEEQLNAFRQGAMRIAGSGVKGFGEIALHHVSLNASHPYESVPADHQLMKLLADIAADHNLVLDLHFDPVLGTTKVPSALASFPNPPVFESNIEAFERLLAHNRKTKVVWAHAGGNDHLNYFKPALVRELASRHPNLYFSIRPRGSTAGVMLSDNGDINPDWIKVVEDLPDRFVFGSDSFLVQPTARAGTAARLFAPWSRRQRDGIRTVMNSLSPETAAKVSYQNAKRLYGLE